MPTAAVFAGGRPSDFPERFIEISCIVEAAFRRHGDQIDFYSVLEDHGDGFVNPSGIDMVPGGEAANLLKQGAKIVWCQPCQFRKILKGYFFAEVFVNVGEYLLNIPEVLTADIGALIGVAVITEKGDQE